MNHRTKIEVALDALFGLARPAGCVSAGVLMLGLSACASLTPAGAPDAASAIRIACATSTNAGRSSKCGYVSATLKKGIWRVLAPYACPKGLTCVGGDMYALVSKKSGQVVGTVLGEQHLESATSVASALDQ